jgi:hypothetical protein
VTRRPSRIDFLPGKSVNDDDERIVLPLITAR